MIRRLTFQKYLYCFISIVFLVSLYTISRVLFYWFNKDLFTQISTDELIAVFFGGLRFDLAGIFYLNAFYIIAILLPFSFTAKPLYQKAANIYFSVINIIGLAMNFFDIVYFPYALKRTTADIFTIFINEENSGIILIKGFWQYREIAGLFLVMAALIIIFTKKVNWKHVQPQSPFVLFAHQVLFLVSVYFMVSAIRGGFWGRYTRPLAVNNAGKYVSDFRNMAIVLNTPFTVIRTWNEEAFELKSYFPNDELDEIFTPVKRINKDDGVLNKNVVIIIVESLSREHSGKLNPGMENGKYRGYTPFLDSLMDHSLTFTNAYANGRKSIDALPSIITGIPSLNMHYVISRYSTNRLTGLGHILKENGYDLSFFHGAPNGSMGFSAFMNLAGFKKYYGKNEFNNKAFYDGTWGIWDEEFLQFMAKKVNDFPQPFCTVVFTLSSHHPFDVPEKYKGKFPKGPREILECVGYTDFALKQFFMTAAQMPWYKNTLFVITADHATVPYHDEYKNDVGNFAVPIIFYTPDGTLKGFDDRVAQHPDIFPTILDYLNINTPFISFGSSLLNPKNERLAFYFSRISYRLIQDSLVIEYDGDKFNSLYNYKRDPLLQHNILSENTMQKQEMKSNLKAVIQQYTNRMIQDNLTIQPQEIRYAKNK